MGNIKFWALHHEHVEIIDDQVFQARGVLVDFEDQNTGDNMDRYTQEDTGDPVLFPVKALAAVVHILL